jgi:hypothetical protein
MDRKFLWGNINKILETTAAGITAGNNRLPVTR